MEYFELCEIMKIFKENNNLFLFMVFFVYMILCVDFSRDDFGFILDNYYVYR